MRYEIRLMFKRITNPQYTIRSDYKSARTVSARTENV